MKLSSPEERFARALMRKLAAAGDTRQAYFDAQRFQLCFSQDDQEVGSANLRNLYEEYQAHSSLERPGYLKSAVRSLLARARSRLRSEMGAAACSQALGASSA